MSPSYRFASDFQRASYYSNSPYNEHLYIENTLSNCLQISRIFKLLPKLKYLCFVITSPSHEEKKNFVAFMGNIKKLRTLLFKSSSLGPIIEFDLGFPCQILNVCPLVTSD